MVASVAIDLALDRLFTYEVPAEFAEKLRIGQLLRVPFGHRTARGFALALRGAEPATQDVLPANQGVEPATQDKQGFAIKPILGIEDEAPFFSTPVLELVKWIAGYTCSPIETCLKCAVPGAVLKPNARPKERLFVEPIARPPASALSSGDSDSPSRLLTPYQAELLANLVRVGGGWMQQLCREFKTTAATLRALEARGAVSISQKAQRRDPLAGRSVMPTKPLVLNEMQRAALEKIMASDRPVLLHTLAEFC